MSESLEHKLRLVIAEVIRDEVKRAVKDAMRPDEMLSTTAAAKVAGVAVVTIRRWAQGGKLTQHRAGRVLRVSRLELERLLKVGASNDATPEQLATKMFG